MALIQHWLQSGGINHTLEKMDGVNSFEPLISYNFYIVKSEVFCFVGFFFAYVTILYARNSLDRVKRILSKACWMSLEKYCVF